MRYRLHVCLKSTLLFAIVISLSAAFAQPSPTRSDSIVVFAPHPDDEVIGCAGIIMQALARGARVKVVDITSGDGFDAAAAGVPQRKLDQVVPMTSSRCRAYAKPRAAMRLRFSEGKTTTLLCL